MSPSATYIVIAAAIVALSVARAALDRREGWRRAFDALGRAEVGAIAAMLFALILIGVTQIVLRNTARTGIMWAEPLMRHIVLWLGCFGATLATSRVRHINIDVFTRLVPDVLAPIRHAIVYGATAVAAFFLGIAALRLVIDEREFGDIAFGAIPTWVLQTVLPFAFFLIAYRSLLNLWLRREPDPGGAELEA